MQCKICGDTTTSTNYGVISCMSCKVFFQRHGCNNTDNLANLKCYSSDGRCQINRDTRKRCIHCRLTACLQAGMRRKIRIGEKSTQNRQQFEEKCRLLVEKKYKHAQPATLDLLHADRSSLDTNQWNIISNITHIYDTLLEEYKQKILHLQMHCEQKPIKLRLKISNYQQLMGSYFTFIVLFLERIADYQSLKLSHRLTLFHHDMNTLITINAHYMVNLTGFSPSSDKSYAPILTMIYGSEILFENKQLCQKLDVIFHTDLILFKLALAIFAFSNVTPCLSVTSQVKSKSMHDEMILSKLSFQIQNNYVDILWRYMLFRFRQEEVVIRLYSNIVYHFLRVQNVAFRTAEQIDSHKDTIQNMIEQVETKLNLQNEI